MTLTILLIAALAGVAVYALGMRVSSKASAQSPVVASRNEAPPPGKPAPANKDEQPAFETEATAAVFDECFKLAFDVQRFDYEITGPHAAVLEKIASGLSFENTAKLYWVEAERPVTVCVATPPTSAVAPSVSLAGAEAPTLYTTR